MLDIVLLATATLSGVFVGSVWSFWLSLPRVLSVLFMVAASWLWAATEAVPRAFRLGFCAPGTFFLLLLLWSHLREREFRKPPYNTWEHQLLEAVADAALHVLILPFGLAVGTLALGVSTLVAVLGG